MIEAAARWIARAVSLLLLGPLAAWGAGLVVAPDGSGASTLLTGVRPGAALVALGVVAACVLVASVVAARLADRQEALLNAGFVLGWVAWTGGAIDEVIRLTPEAATLVRLGVEALVLALVVLAALAASDRLSRRGSVDEGLCVGPRAVIGSVRARAGLAVLGVSLIAGLVGAWLFARYGGTGQGLGAAFIGGVIAGVFGSLVYQSATKGEGSVGGGTAAILLPAVMGVMAAGVVGPLIGLVFPGGGRLLLGLARSELPGWVLISPAGWVAGALIGAPVGVSFVTNRVASGSAAERDAGGDAGTHRA